MCGGAARPADGESRFWSIDSDCHLRWRGPRNERGRSDTPVPGDRPVVVCDPWGLRKLVLLDDGSTFEYETLPGRRPVWRSMGNYLGGSTVKENRSNERPRLVAAFILRSPGARSIYGITPERGLLRLSEGLSPVTLGVVPGTARVLAVDLLAEGVTLLMDDGRLFTLTARSGWVSFANLLDAGRNGLLRVVATGGFSLGGGRDVQEGHEFELPLAEARALLASGRVRLAPEPENAA